ncbi:hypothetical protein L1885_09160, partial [Streptomyces fuscigenes]|nr:hypothetical protein [Streptomyces fuscigenes]
TLQGRGRFAEDLPRTVPRAWAPADAQAARDAIDEFEAGVERAHRDAGPGFPADETPSDAPHGPHRAHRPDRPDPYGPPAGPDPLDRPGRPARPERSERKVSDDVDR